MGVGFRVRGLGGLQKREQVEECFMEEILHHLRWMLKILHDPT